MNIQIKMREIIIFCYLGLTMEKKHWIKKPFKNIYVPNIGVPKYRKQILTDLKGRKRQQYNNTRGL